MGVVIQIEGVDRSSVVKMGSLNITDRINQATDLASFSIEKYPSQTFVPEVNQEVIITVDGTRAYGGVIVEVAHSMLTPTSIIYDVTCKDYSHYLDRLLVIERYTDTNVQAVILDLIDRYADDYGFTGDGVMGADIPVASVSFNEIKLSDCLDKLARLTGCYWYVDYFQDIHFFKKSTELAPFDLTDTSGNYIYMSLALKDDFSQIRNSVKVRGGEAIAEERTELLTGDGEKDTFPLANKFSELPVVEVDGYPVDVGIDFLQNDIDFDVMWNFQQKYLRFTAGNTPGAPLSGETNISVTGLPLKPIVVQRVDSVSIARYGLFEHSIRQDTIRSRDEALQFALADLQSYADKISAGSFQTYTPGLKSGQTIRINSALRDWNELCIIQGVTFTMLTPTDYKWSVDVATVKTLSVVEFLQKLLLKDRIEAGEDETLLNFFQFSDAFTMNDLLGDITATTSEDYVVEQDDEESDSYPNPAIINKSTMSA